jgi:hypothetical protein
MRFTPYNCESYTIQQEFGYVKFWGMFRPSLLQSCFVKQIVVLTDLSYSARFKHAGGVETNSRV